MAWNHTLLADLSGPHFLLLYLVLISGTLTWVGVNRRTLDPTAAERPPQVPLHPDPYEIAYLRGGENEVTRVTILNLIQRGYLEIQETRKGRMKEQHIGQSPASHDTAALSSTLERDVFRDFTGPRTAREIFQSSLPRTVKGHCTGYEQALRAERLLATEEQKQAVRRLGWTAALIILGLGGYKLAAALVNGYDNVVFLLLMAVVSTVVLAVMVQPRRLSRRGDEYLRRLQQAFQTLKRAGGVQLSHDDQDDLVKQALARRPRMVPIEAEMAVVDPLVLRVAVFGTASLAGTPQAAYGQMFAQSASSGGGCGGGGGGCGGGGCGGGGCGGCGGG